MLIACVGGESSWLFFFKELVQSLEQRQSLLLKQTHDLHIQLVSTVLHQAIFLEPKLPTQYSLDSRAEKDNCYAIQAFIQQESNLKPRHLTVLLLPSSLP